MSSKFHPFNGLKALVHVERWKSIQHRQVPPPLFVSLDPFAQCNYACPFCNAQEAMSDTASKMSRETMSEIVELLKEWQTKAVCVGGGGESLLNENTSFLINQLADIGIQIGVVTNGTHLNKHHEALSRCVWVGISMDAGTKQTYMQMKGIASDRWDEVIRNIKDFSRIKPPQTQLTWKFLIHPSNCAEIYEACKEAKNAGCDIIHIRPGAQPWFDLRDGGSFAFSQSAVTIAKQQIQLAKELEDDRFRVFAVSEKFTDLYGVKKPFSKCNAVFTTCFINERGEVGLCCDRRGDKALVLGSLKDIRQTWGSERHFNIAEAIKVDQCPRCTLTHVNEIFENVILQDNMLYNMY